MLDGWKSRLLVLGWGAFLGAFAFLAATDFALISNANWCGATSEHCLRDWIGALSGWVAAVAAFLAIGPLLGQLREQRRQTGFTLGDSEPTVDIERRAHMSLRIRIVNWNRRTLKLRGLEFTADGQGITLRSILRANEHQGYTPIGDHGFSIEGWEDREKRPPFSDLAIELESNGVGDVTLPIEVNIVGVLIGEGGGLFRRRLAVNRWGTLS